jgi:predicted amidohydrolase YtcJ
MKTVAIALLALGVLGHTDANPRKLTIFHHGRIFTSDPAHPLIDDGGVAVLGNLVIKVGSSESVLKLRTPGAELIDLEGKVLLPGFNDAHVHPFDYFTFPEFGKGAVVVNDNSFVPGAGPSLPEVLAAVTAGARANPPGTWLMAFVGTQALGDPSLNRLTIDAVAPDHPVLLAAWFGHGTFINTRAVSTLGFSLTEPDPAGGFFGRFSNGELNGEVREYAEHRIRRFFSERMTDPQLVKAFEQYARLAAQAGYTTIQEFAVGLPQKRHLDIVRTANIGIRIRAHCFPLALDEPCDIPPDFAPENPFATKYAGGNKWIDDGTPIERLSFLRDAYEDDPGNAGRPNFSGADIRAQFDRAVHGPAERRQILIHQTGDALADVLFAAQRGAGGSREFWRQRRPRLEHGFVLQPEQIAQAADWGWTVVTNPIFYSLPDLWHARLGPAQESAVWPTRTLLKSGAHLAIGSDAVTVVPGPFVDLFFAQINPSNPSESISLQDAIVAYTKGSAYAEFKDEVKGSLAPLHAADLIVIDQDIFALGDHPEKILNTKVLLTMVNGDVVHEVPRALKRN